MEKGESLDSYESRDEADGLRIATSILPVDPNSTYPSYCQIIIAPNVRECRRRMGMMQGTSWTCFRRPNSFSERKTNPGNDWQSLCRMIRVRLL